MMSWLLARRHRNNIDRIPQEEDKDDLDDLYLIDTFVVIGKS